MQEFRHQGLSGTTKFGMLYHSLVVDEQVAGKVDKLPPARCRIRSAAARSQSWESRLTNVPSSLPSATMARR